MSKSKLIKDLKNEVLLLEQQQKKNVSYTALVLTTRDHVNLYEMVSDKIPNNWKKIAHHVTINMGPWKGNPSLLGVEYPIRVLGFAKNDLVAAVKVSIEQDGYNWGLKNTSHITIAVNVEAGGKPVMSNQLDYNNMEQMPMVILSGKLVEVSNNEIKFAEEYR